MPHALLAGHADRNPSTSSSSSSSTDPPQGTSTEQYLPVQHQPGATESEALYHARLHSYGSDLDEHRDEDTSTMPAPKRMGTRAAFSSPLKNEEQTNTTQLPTHLSIPGKHSGTGTGQTTRSANHSPPHSAMSHSKQPSSFSPGVAAPKNSASSRALSPQTASTSQASAPRRGIVDASEYHYSTRSRVSSPPLQVVQASSLKPLRRCSPLGNHGTKTALTETAATTTKERTPLSPEPVDNTFPSHAAAPTHPPVPSTVPWQLSSPQERERRSDDQVGEGGAIFAYASEAVSTLEQQYADAIQRLHTMHRLYSRLEAHNCTLEREMQRMRKVEDVLRNHITFYLHSTVQQLKHEMKILKQYILLMSSNFGNQLKVLSQAHSEELLRLVRRHYTCTSLQSSGAGGWHQPMQARVSVGVPGAAAASLEREAKGSCSSNSNRHISGDWSAVVAGAQTWSPERWWNANDSRSGGATEAWPALAPGHLLPRTEKSEDANGVAESPGGGALVSDHTYRALQIALAAAQKRAIELEHRCSTRQEEYESRIRQLKIAHRAKETTLTEELMLLRRRAEQVHSIDLPQATSQKGSTGEASVPITPEYLNQLGQLLLELQRQQPTPKQEVNAPSTALTLASMLEVALQASGKEGKYPLHSLEKTGETVRQADSQHDDRSTSTTSNNYTHGTRRAHGKGGGGGLHMPHRHSPAAAAHLRERAREVLGGEVHSNEARKQGQRTDHGSSRSPHLRKKVPAGVAAPAASTTKGSLAYDRLLNYSRSPPRLGSFRDLADKSDHFVARVRSFIPRGAESRSIPRRTPSSHEQRSGRAMSGTRRNATADHRPPISLLTRAAHVGVRGDALYAVTAPGSVQYGPSEIDIDVDRVAQGIWAKELLEERSHL